MCEWVENDWQCKYSTVSTNFETLKLGKELFFGMEIGAKINAILMMDP